MQEKDVERGFATWYSTYGSLTVERVLELLHIKIEHDALVVILKKPDHILHDVLHLPMKNIFNGIIFQQAYDYQVYAQKLMIDYRLSPEFSKDAESPGVNIRNDLAEQYDQLLKSVQLFSAHQYEHYRLISESQAYLIERIKQFNDPLHELDILNDDVTFKEKMKEYEQRSDEIGITFRNYRSQFYNLILGMTERLTSLPDYHFDAAHAAKERESLFFDKEIGGE
jgi:hypothetical protein